MKGTFFTVAILALLTGCDGAKELAAKLAGDGKRPLSPSARATRFRLMGRLSQFTAPVHALQLTSSRTRYSAQGRMREIVRAW